MLALFLVACANSPAPSDRTPVTLTPGPPYAGVASVVLDLPVGGPLGGYTARSQALGRASQTDDRRSAYVDVWAVSDGIQTPQRGHVLWLSNGDENLVIVKADLIYSFDGLVEDLERRLEADTGLDLDGHVIVTASHTHHGVANFSHQVHFYLGGDKYNEEVYQRLATSLEEAAVEAHTRLEPAAIGLGIAKDWDPHDRVYSDRRAENDDLQMWSDIPAGPFKDPYLYVLRVDSAAGEPMGVFFTFGIHGTVLDEDNPMISTDSLGGLEQVLAERFGPDVVVSHWQGSGGDSSPRGSDSGYAELETIGEYAADPIYDLWEATPTSTDPITIEAITHAIPEDHDDMKVTRNGTVDWIYRPYKEGYTPDGIIYDDDGSVKSPIDEFNAQYGAAFCGNTSPFGSAGNLGTDVYPYDGCVDLKVLMPVVQGIFELTDEQAALPMPSSTRANTTVARIGPIHILDDDGTETVDDVLFGFFPGEPTAMYGEQFRRRAQAELGFAHTVVVGYAQDHEGYLLIPEDWLLGGYEPTINVWGPLQGEAIMEGMLASAAELLTDVREPQDPTHRFQPTSYDTEALPAVPPDETPGAGTVVDSVPDDLWTPLDVTPTAQPDATVARVQGLAQFIWQGGDPAVDRPRVTLQRQDDTGEWVNVTSASGRTITEEMPDILLAWVPEPLYPADADQTHIWWAAWQAVGHVLDRAGVPEGTYRFHVSGKRYVGGSTTWPWATADYEVSSDPFEVVPATLSLSLEGTDLSVWLEAPAWGYRLVDLDGSSKGANPVLAPTITWELSDGSTQSGTRSEQTVIDGVTHLTVVVPEDAVAVDITDAYGNSGHLDL